MSQNTSELPASPTNTVEEYLAYIAGQSGAEKPDYARNTIEQYLAYISEHMGSSTVGRFLSLWNCATGKPITDPTTLPYTYKTGDYYIVKTVAGSYTHTLTITGTEYSGYPYTVTFSFQNTTFGSYTTLTALSAALHQAGHTGHSGTCPATGTITKPDGDKALGYVASDAGVSLLLQTDTTEAIGVVYEQSQITTITDTVSGGMVNYKPDGTIYTGAASTTSETETVKSDDIYWFDGSVWKLNPAGTYDVRYIQQGLTTAQKAQARTNINAQETALTQTVTIAVADWAGGTTCTKNITGVTTTNIVIADISDADIDITAQGDGTLTFAADLTPTEAITVKVVIL